MLHAIFPNVGARFSTTDNLIACIQDQHRDVLVFLVVD